MRPCSPCPNPSPSAPAPGAHRDRHHGGGHARVADGVHRLAARLGAVTSRPTQDRALTGSLRAPGLTTVLGGVLGSFISTSYAQNVGLVALSRIRSRYVVALCGAFLVLMGLVPVLGSLVALVPLPVLGGAGVVFFCRHPAEPSVQPPRPRHRSRTSTRFPPSGSPRSAAPALWARPLRTPPRPSGLPSAPRRRRSPRPYSDPYPAPRRHRTPRPCPSPRPAAHSSETGLPTTRTSSPTPPIPTAIPVRRPTSRPLPKASASPALCTPLHPLHSLRNRSGHPNDPTTHGRDARSGWHRPVGAIRDARRGNAER
ncbi:solute carrier family 23 protein [Streptomyces sp. NPDC004520]|uniref:solute carrier family 23 protein n=1 Tax=Streptomyces sp. NPDC004520 TaxID=3364702 RepID=UPI0036B042AE